jgi:moderate conductance mechanosensitive channel
MPPEGANEWRVDETAVSSPPSSPGRTAADSKGPVQAGGKADSARPPLEHLVQNQAKTTPLPVPGKAAAAPPEEISQAEQITRLERTIEGSLQRISELKTEIQGPRSEFLQAEAAYKLIDEMFAAQKAEVERHLEAGNAAAAAEARQLVAAIEKKWKLARERFDLAIETRKTLQQQLAALEEKDRQNQAALDKLKGVPAASESPLASPGTNPPGVALAPPAGSPAAAPPANTTAASPEAVSGAAAPPPGLAPGAAASNPLAVLPADPATAAAAAGAAAADEKKPSKELVQAQNQAQIKKGEALEAEQEAQSVSERIAILDRVIELEQKLLVAARKKSDIAYQTGEEQEQDFEKQASDGAAAAVLQELRTRRRETADLFAAARAEVRQRTDRIQELQQQRADLQREELSALSQAVAKQEEADKADDRVAALVSPFSATNVIAWLVDHGTKVLAILAAMALLRWIVRLSSQRIVELMVDRGARGTKQEREDRAKTLVGVFHNAFSITIVIGGLLMICEEVGIAVGPLMGGAAVLGLAVAFGAQNLIRDYFYGFVILIENQYKLNDVLRIGEMTGQVEQITLRMTVLRDLAGNVHFIPNGKIDSVTNMTHGWSRAVFDVGVAYREDVDQVMDVLMELATDLRRDPAFSTLIIDDPEMLGVDGLSDSAVVIKFLIKTRPLQQWRVKRELLRRIKRRFDELGIEIPFPHRTVFHRMDGSVSEGALDSGMPLAGRRGLPREMADDASQTGQFRKSA